MRERRAVGPNSRTGYVVCFRTPPPRREAGVRVPDYGHLGKFLAATFSILYGKRFDSHGSIESTGSFFTPDMFTIDKPCSPELPQNNREPRANFPINLDLREIGRIRPLIFKDESKKDFYKIFDTAVKFYHLALQNAESDYEIAYLNLVTAGEVLSNAFAYDKDDLLDPNIKNLLNRI